MDNELHALQGQESPVALSIAAETIGLTPKWLRDYYINVKPQKLKAFRRSDKGNWMVMPSEIKRFMKNS